MTATRSQPVSAAAPERDPLAILTLAALVMAIALVLVRVTMMEVVRDSFDLPSGSESITFPGPTTSLVLNLLCFVPAILVLIRRSIDPTYVLRPHWSHVPMLLLGMWVLCSVGWASDKFAALITACDWCAALAIGWATSQLVRTWTRLRIVLATAVGVLLICMAQGAIFKYVELPETVRQWDEMKAEAFRARNWQPTDFAAQQFDRKVRAGEMVGFYKSPNTFAAVIALGGLIAAGFAVQRWLYGRDDVNALLSSEATPNAVSATTKYPQRDPKKQLNDDQIIGVLFAIPAALAIAMIWLAQSRTALAGLLLCAAGFAGLWQIRRWLAAHSRTAFIAGVVVVLLAVAGVIAIGLGTGGLLHPSLTFRWQYWQGAWALFQSQPMLGTGWSNFGSAYLQFRLPVAAEEIKDPHNVVIKLLTEVGLIGALLAVAWLGLSAREATRAASPRAGKLRAGGNIVPVLVTIALLFAAGRVISNTPLSLLVMELLKLLLFVALLLFALILAVVRGKADFSADDRPAPVLLWAAIIGLGGFLLHNMVDFALFENGPMMLFMLVLGSVLGVRHPGVAGEKPRTWAAVASLGALFVALLAMVGLVIVPVATAESHAQAATEAAPRSRADALSLMRQAMAASPVPNYDYAMRATQYMGNASSADVLSMYAAASNADPINPQPRLNSARYRRSLPMSDSGSQPSLIRADYASVIARNPSDPTLRVEYADWLDTARLPTEAAEQYRAALEANAKMDATEPRRLPATRVEQIEDRLRQP